MSVVFSDRIHEFVTKRIASTYEREIWRRRKTVYTQARWENLPENCQQEHADIAAAALSGTTYEGHTLPEWVVRIADSYRRQYQR